MQNWLCCLIQLVVMVKIFLVQEFCYGDWHFEGCKSVRVKGFVNVRSISCFESTCLLCMGIPRLANRIKHHVMKYALTCPRLWRSARARVYQELYHDSTAMFTVCIHGLLRHSIKYFVIPLHVSSTVGHIYTNIQRLSEFAFFSRNKSDKKGNLSHQSLNITSSSNAMVKILFHTIYFSSRRFV